MTFILVDTANTFFRARHAVKGDLEMKIGMSLHVTLNSVKKAWNDFNGSHVIFCLEGRSWRKDHYAPYKRNRSDARAAHNEKEAEEERVFWETFDQFKSFINEKTNCWIGSSTNRGKIQLEIEFENLIRSLEFQLSKMIFFKIKK